jgi:hypothetical protein
MFIFSRLKKNKGFLVFISIVVFIPNVLFANQREADKSAFIPARIHKTSESKASIFSPMSKSVRQKYLDYLIGLRKAKSQNFKEFKWTEVQPETTLVKVNLSNDPSAANPYILDWLKFTPRSFYVVGQSPRHNYSISEVYFQYSSCISSARSKNEIGYCAEKHAINDLKSKTCPDRDNEWLENQNRIKTEFLNDYHGVTLEGPGRILVIPRNLVQFYNKYASQIDYSAAETYTRRLFEFQIYLAEPYACYVAMMSWADVGTQSKSFRPGYNFIEGEVEMIISFSNKLETEAIITPANFQMPQLPLAPHENW